MNERQVKMAHRPGGIPKSYLAKAQYTQTDFERMALIARAKELCRFHEPCRSADPKCTLLVELRELLAC